MYTIYTLHTNFHLNQNLNELYISIYNTNYLYCCIKIIISHFEQPKEITLADWLICRFIWLTNERNNEPISRHTTIFSTRVLIIPCILFNLKKITAREVEQSRGGWPRVNFTCGVFQQERALPPFLPPRQK